MRVIRAIVALVILGVVGWWVYNNCLLPAQDVAIRIEAEDSAIYVIARERIAALT